MVVNMKVPRSELSKILPQYVLAIEGVTHSYPSSYTSYLVPKSDDGVYVLRTLIYLRSLIATKWSATLIRFHKILMYFQALMILRCIAYDLEQENSFEPCGAFCFISDNPTFQYIAVTPIATYGTGFKKPNNRERNHQLQLS